MPTVPGRQRELKDRTEEYLRLSIPAKRRHSTTVPGSYQLDAVNIGRRYSAHIRDTKS